ncbi:MAG: Stf0 family sulfotransferase [Cyanobacteria bacterium J06559_3]
MATNSYIICSTVRSGSTLLCKTLGQLKECGQPEEYFHRHIIKRLKLRKDPEKFLSYCRAIFREGVTHHGTFGIKLHWWQLLDFLSLARQLPQFKEKQDLEILGELFPNPKFIYLRRKNMTAQAISAAIAAQTGQWERLNEQEAKSLTLKPAKTQSKASKHVQQVKFQPWKIYEWEASLRSQNQAWQHFFQENSLRYHEITYENLIQSFSQEIGRALDYIGICKSQSLEAYEMPTRRQANQMNQRFIRYYTLLPKPFSALLYWLYQQLQAVRNGGVK